MKELQSRIKQLVRNWPSSKTFTAADIQVSGPLTLNGQKQYAQAEIQKAIDNLVEDKFLGESQLERRRAETTYYVRGQARHPWGKRQARSK